LLLESGARQTSETSPAALAFATRSGDVEIVSLLLESGARQTPETSRYALEFAAMSGDVEIVSLLLESGARQTPATSSGALQEATDRGHVEIVKMLRAVETMDQIKERLDGEIREIDAEELNASIDNVLHVYPFGTWWDKQRKALIDLFERRCGALIKQIDIESFAKEFPDTAVANQ
jgi:ankyrin repeat protein